VSQSREELLFNEVPHNDEAEEILDRKIIAYLNREFPEVAPYTQSMIFYKNGNEEKKLYEIMRIPVLSKEPNSGFKIDYDLLKNNEWIQLKYNIEGKSVIFVFTIYQNKLRYDKLIDFETKQSDWDLTLKILSQEFQNILLLKNLMSSYCPR
jgi:hypothetical protein